MDMPSVAKACIIISFIGVLVILILLAVHICNRCRNDQILEEASRLLSDDNSALQGSSSNNEGSAVMLKSL